MKELNNFRKFVNEGSCGYTPDGKPRSKPASPDLMKEAEYAADKFNVNVFGYQTKYYKVCPGAKAFMDKVVAGDYGEMNKDEAIRLAKLHDLLFMYELKALKDSEYAANILDDAIYVVGVIKDQVQSMGMPIADVGYLDNHIEIIRDEAEEINENINEGHGLDKGDVDFLQSFVDRMGFDKEPVDAKEFSKLKKILKFIIKSNILQDKTKDLSKGKVNEVIDLVHVYDKDGKIFGTGEIEKELPNDKVKVRFDGNFVGTFRADRVKPVKEGKLNENQDDSYYIDEIKRDLEELDDKEANEYLDDLSKAILKLKR